MSTITGLILGVSECACLRAEAFASVLTASRTSSSVPLPAGIKLPAHPLFTSEEAPAHEPPHANPARAAAP